ncbi:MAG: endopeptidase La, partial [Prevotellaceae bacterium]|nr:endopeptidase La [Prevotellaceae bacterium]
MPQPADNGEGSLPMLPDGNAAGAQQADIPTTQPLLVLRNSVLFPGIVIPINISRAKSVRAARAAYASDKNIVAVMQHDSKQDDPTFDELHKVGTAAHILRLLEMPDGSTTVILQGTRRIVLEELLSSEPFFTVRVALLEDIAPKASKDYDLLAGSIRDVAVNIINLSPNLPNEAGFAIKNIDNKQFLINYIATNTELSGAEKQTLLEHDKFEERASALLQLLLREQQAMALKSELQQKVHEGINQHNREYFLHEQLKAIQSELGGNPTEQAATTLREKAKGKKWSEEAGKVFERELGKLEKMHPYSGEYPVQLNYLQVLTDLPWGECTEDKIDLNEAQKALNEDHYGLEEVKDRILEHLAVIKLKGNSLKSPILCLYGPPGVGKTSLGKSVARALGREFGRIALGGLHDEAEIRGHRKTYVGAMPGRIIQTIRRCKSSNPVIILDEVDKVGNDFRGDPSSALLEVLDPEQNAAFYDNYLELDYDLSHVLFITTANGIATIHPALRDRMEMISVSGYTPEEKVEIVKRHLLPRLLDDHGVKPDQLHIPDELLSAIIEDYTRESGVRGVEKQLAKIIRHTARAIASEQAQAPTLTREALRKALGTPKFTRDKALDTSFTGVATGLAWTVNGGEILFVEASVSKGKGAIATTGQLGDVMKESAIIALEYVRAHAELLGIDPKAFEKHNLHVHVPEGAIPKDGPSAGITMVTAIASVYAGRKVRRGLAMTGEATLRGKVLPVGGIKEKLLAAKRAGIADLILPSDNKKDVDEIKQEYLHGLRFTYVDDIQEVLTAALEQQG